MEEYSNQKAKYYKNYRPPLHLPLLTKYLGNQHFKTALDIGCGLGHSSKALTSFCENVIGFDTSKAMLQKAIQHKKIKYTTTYQKLDYDLMCFFGSLSYVSLSELTLYTNDLASRGSIICCDFEVKFNSFVKQLKLKVIPSDYPHSKTLNDYPLQQSLECIQIEKDLFQFECSTKELIQLMLSEQNIKNAIEVSFKTHNPEVVLEKEINAHHPTKIVSLKADGFFSHFKKH